MWGRKRMYFNWQEKSLKMCEMLKKKIQIWGFGEVQKRANLVDLEKCCKMNVWLQKAASIQPRTDLPKRLGYRHYPQTPSPCAWPTKQRRRLRLFPELPLFPGEPVEPDIAEGRGGSVKICLHFCRSSRRISQNCITVFDRILRKIIGTQEV